MFDHNSGFNVCSTYSADFLRPIQAIQANTQLHFFKHLSAFVQSHHGNVTVEDLIQFCQRHMTDLLHGAN